MIENQNKKEEKDMKGGVFAGFVLLSSNEWNPEQLCSDLKQEWGIEIPENSAIKADSEESEDAADKEQDSFVWNIDGMVAAVSLIPAPVPNGEAEQNASMNYLWPEAEEMTKTHKAHILVAVLGNGKTPVETGQLHVKLCDACLKQKNAIGVYTSGTVFEPQFYREAADVMRGGELPYLNWIYFGLYRTEKGTCGYTYGMTAFGKEEIEVLDSEALPQELRDFLFSVAVYVLSGDIVLKDGETIGFTAEQKLPISRSEGAALEGETLKIEFRPAGEGA